MSGYRDGSAPKSDSGSSVARFLNDLRVAPTTVNDQHHGVDWDDAPWPIKVYDGGARLSLPVPAARPGLPTPAARPGLPTPAARPGQPDPLDPVGAWLYHGFGITRLRTADVHRPAAQDGLPVGRRLVYRRSIPSGGGMYPAEVYLLCPSAVDRNAVLAAHYDPYRHELLRLDGTTASRPAQPEAGVEAGNLLLVLSNRFWKNFYKYGDFAYRLGAVDTGVALGRALRLATHLFGGPATVRFDFDDEALDALLGLDGNWEATYVTVSVRAEASQVLAEQLASLSHHAPVPTTQERSRQPHLSERFQLVHNLARSARTRGQSLQVAEAGEMRERVCLPAVEALPHWVDDLHRRTSNGALFQPRPATERQLAAVLRDSWDRYQALLRGCGDGPPWPPLWLYCAVLNVTGVRPGWYEYLPAEGGLAPAGPNPDSRPGPTLQAALRASTMNAELSAFCVHVVSAARVAFHDGDARQYRVQQMLVGSVVESLTSAATAVGLGSHAFLGFDAVRLDQEYGFQLRDGRPIGQAEFSRGTHAQVCIGNARPDTQLEIGTQPRRPIQSCRGPS